MPEQYSIKSNYGYGDWHVSYYYSAEEAIADFNTFCYTEFATIEECLNYDNEIYSMWVGHIKENADWLSS